MKLEYLTFCVSSVPIPHLHVWRQMEVCLKFCNILKWSAEMKCARKINMHKQQKPSLTLEIIYHYFNTLLQL
jgi:hypothetical protein